MLAALVAANGCADSPTAAQTRVPVIIIFLASGAKFDASLDGRTYDEVGFYNVSLAAGSHEMTGSFDGTDFLVGFSGFPGGGVTSGSVRSELGPNPAVGACNIEYSTTASGDKAFRIRFSVATGGTVCQ